MLRTYRIEYQSPNGSWLVDLPEKKSFVDASEHARTECAKMPPGTRIVSIIEHQAYMELIEEARQ